MVKPRLLNRSFQRGCVSAILGILLSPGRRISLSLRIKRFLTSSSRRLGRELPLKLSRNNSIGNAFLRRLIFPRVVVINGLILSSFDCRFFLAYFNLKIASTWSNCSQREKSKIWFLEEVNAAEGILATMSIKAHRTRVIFDNDRLRRFQSANTTSINAFVWQILIPFDREIQLRQKFRQKLFP